MRFDFSHFQKVTPEELRKVERIVNAAIREDIPFEEYRDTPIEEAKKLGAIALFGEKYGDKVRVVKFGKSVEFCGGCHAKSTGCIGLFHIISESSVAAGVRRIEAITGAAAEELMYLTAVIKKTVEENGDLHKRIDSFVQKQVDDLKDTLIKRAENRNGVTVVKSILPIKPEAAKDLAFKIAAAVPENLFCILGTTDNDKPMLTLMISKNLVKDHNLNAGQIVREAAKLIQGGGGGAPHFATAGGHNLDGLNAALDKALEVAGI